MKHRIRMLGNPHIEKTLERLKGSDANNGLKALLASLNVGPMQEFKNHGVTADSGGPGTELKRLLKWFVNATPTCPCNLHAAKMNRWGCNKCEANAEEIVAWMINEANKRKLPLSNWGKWPSRLLLKRAISNARKKGYE